MRKRTLTGQWQGFTRRSVSVTQSGKLNVLLTSGIWRVGSTTTPDQEIVEGDYEAQLLELRNISEKLAQIQQRKSLEAYDISRSIDATKAALVALYNSIGYTAGIEALLDNEKEGVVE